MIVAHPTHKRPTYAQNIMTDLRYPIGKFTRPTDTSAAKRKAWIDAIAATPAQLRAAIEGLTEEQLDTPYRPNGWTIRQVVHHVPDSHLNSYIRFKWLLTEDEPLIKIYDEKLWAELTEARTAPVDLSLDLLEALHVRFVLMLRSLSEEDYARTFRHPEWGAMTAAQMLALYAWHGPHHTAHITSLRERMGW